MILDSMIFGYLDRIGRSTNPRQVAEALGDEAARLGLSAVACWMLTGPKAASRNPFYANNWPRPWFDLYERQGYLEKDPFARWAISSGAPVSWSALLRRLPANDPAHRISLAARNFGLREGFGTPVRSTTGHLGLFTFFGDRRPLTSSEQIFLQAICPGTLHRMEALSPSAEPARPAGVLSARERECAALLCEGLSNPAIADRLGITVATVKFHLANACAKLGARSRAQLAALLPSTAIGESRGDGPNSSRPSVSDLESPEPGTGEDRAGSAGAERTPLLLRSTDGRFFEMAIEDALPFEVTPGRHRSPQLRAVAPTVSERVTMRHRTAANDVEPQWAWRTARAIGERRINR